jgi:hypothetical protein
MSLSCVCLYSSPASAQQNLSDAINSYLLDSAIAGGNLRLAKNYKTYAEQPCLDSLVSRGVRCNLMVCNMAKQLPSKEGEGEVYPCNVLLISSLVEQNIQNLVIQLGPGSAQSKAILLNIYRLAWIQYMLYEAFSRGSADEIEASQIESLNALVKTLSYSLFVNEASDKDVLKVRDHMARIIDEDIDREKANVIAENPGPAGAQGPFGLTLTGTLLAKIRSAVCPLWPICDK